MSSKLQGLYQFNEGILENNLQTLQIKSRRAKSDKPHFYLVGINPDESEAYISSLYPHQVDWGLPYRTHFQLDYGNDYFLLTINEWDKVAEIKKIGTKKALTQKKRHWGDGFGGKSRRRSDKPFLADIFKN
jgi:hypothetical protein